MGLFLKDEEGSGCRMGVDTKGEHKQNSGESVAGEKEKRKAVRFSAGSDYRTKRGLCNDRRDANNINAGTSNSSEEKRNETFPSSNKGNFPRSRFVRRHESQEQQCDGTDRCMIVDPIRSVIARLTIPPRKDVQASPAMQWTRALGKKIKKTKRENG